MELKEADNLVHFKRRRGPKPLGLRAQFASTTWLDGEVFWRDGRVVWRVDGREIEVGSRELKSAAQAIHSLGLQEKAARRVCPDFAAWHARRSTQLERARQLVALRAPDLETLASPSRRRNPAAMIRLAQLLLVESSVGAPLPASPARALFGAWPLSQEVLKSALRDENWPLEARALVALTFGAAAPLEALPGEPYLRRAARFGARFGFPEAPQLVIALLRDGSRDAENCALRVLETLQNRGLFAFDEAQLLGLQRAKNDAALVADLAECASRLPDPFGALLFAPVAPKRFDFESRREVLLAWNELKKTSGAAIRNSLAHIARGGQVRDLEQAFALLDQLISAPISACGALKIERNRMARRHQRDLPPFQKSVQDAALIAVELLQSVAASPDGKVLDLLREGLAKRSVCPNTTDLAPPVWAARWHVHVRDQNQHFLAPFLASAEKFGVPTMRKALRLDCWREMGNKRDLTPEVADYALQIIDWAPENTCDVVWRCARWNRYWTGLAGAHASLGPILEALHDDAPPERAKWLDAILGEVDDGRQGVRRDLPALAAFVPAMRRAKTGSEMPHWALAEVALAFYKTGIESKTANALPRFESFSLEMAQKWAAAGEKTPGWGKIGLMVALLSQLAGENEAKWAQLVAIGWKYADWDSDVEWNDVQNGAKLLRGLLPLQNVVSDNFARCPARCFTLLERLGLLPRFDGVRDSLETWREQNLDELGASWQELELDADLTNWAARFARAQRELGECPDPPPKIRKIAAWPQKIAREIAELENREELAPNAAKRLANLRLRLENPAALRVSMGRELAPALRDATMEAELRAAERAVESCYRARLESLGAPKDLVLDADWINAALFSADLTDNRKWLREIIRAECEHRANWRLEIAGNAHWIQVEQERGLNLEAWLSPAPRAFRLAKERIELRLETSPLKILQMGNFFGTCLSRGGCNAPSSVANAVELNKRVVFARDERNRIVGRQLLGLSKDGKLLGFRVYNSSDEQSVSLRAAFGRYARDFAQRCGVELGDEGEVEQLFVADWWDDGIIAWGDLNPPQPKRKSSQKSDS